MTDSELVLALPRAAVPGGTAWRGVRPLDLAGLQDAASQQGVFRPRGALEEDRAWKQLIPYVVLLDGARFFLMRRTRAGGDARLHERWSIGIGGHVNPPDGGILGGLRREWAEELRAEFVPQFEPFGLLNDDDDPVGAVHLGLDFVARADGRSVAVRERDKLEGGFATLEDVRGVREDLETWSQLLLEALEADPAAILPAPTRVP
ncbi:MAG: NUDIX domain-containing protein [Candidatus Limnocylindrales bacterium]